MNQQPQPTLLYRYFFFDWLFVDVNRGTRLERAAAWRHNQAQAHWLGTYLRRWLFCGVALYALGFGIELMSAAAVYSAPFFIAWCISVPISAVIGIAWLGLRSLPAPF